MSREWIDSNFASPELAMVTTNCLIALAKAIAFTLAE
jgi:hypothetical protein